MCDGFCHQVFFALMLTLNIHAAFVYVPNLAIAISSVPQSFIIKKSKSSYKYWLSINQMSTFIPKFNVL